MDFQPHLPLRQQTAEKPAQQREHQHDESGESIGNRRKADPGKADAKGMVLKKDEMATAGDGSRNALNGIWIACGVFVLFIVLLLVLRKKRKED